MKAKPQMQTRTDPLHIWTKPQNVSLDRLTSDGRLETATQPNESDPTADEIEGDLKHSAMPDGFDALADRIENELLDLGVPFGALARVLDLINDVVEVKVARKTADALHGLLWRLGKAGAPLRRALLGTADESLSEASQMDGIPETTLDRKTKAILKKWNSATQLLEA